MRERLIVGPLLVLGVIGLLWAEQRFGGTVFPPGAAIGSIMLVFALVGAGELGAMFRAKGVDVSNWHLRLCAACGLVVSFVDPAAMESRAAGAMIAGSAVAVLFGSLLSFARRRSTQGVTAYCGAALLGFVYLGIMFGFAFGIRREYSAWVLLWVVLTAKACDTGAYFTGRAVGRHKLIPWLSPGKTWEGLLGGTLFAAAVGAAGAWMLDRWAGGAPVGMMGAAAFGAAAAIFGQAGDLIASFLKRDAGLKDSGRLLPGMGGVLDVVDSPLLVLPLAYWWLRLAP